MDNSDGTLYSVPPDEISTNVEIEPQKTRIGKDNVQQKVKTGSANAEPEPERDPYDDWIEERVLKGDALEILPTLTTKFDLIIVDPLYGITSEKWDLESLLKLIKYKNYQP